MKAITISAAANAVGIIDVPEPRIKEPHDIKVKVLEVGICGTDREQVRGVHASLPAGSPYLIIGHEMLGEVTEVGSAVKSVHVGDFGVFSVRRGCGRCGPCLHQRSDMCYTGQYTERGIKAHHGFDTHVVVDDEKYFVVVPPEIRSIGVLAEPLSVAEKAIDEALVIQRARIPGIGEDWVRGRQVLIAGIGAIGLLAAVAMLLRGAKVVGTDVVDEHTSRPALLKRLGGAYVNSKKIAVKDIDDQFGKFDFVFEATGVAEVGFDLIDTLGMNGIYVMTGIPHDERPICITGAQMMSDIVMKNQIILGSVNAGPMHFKMAIDDLIRARQRWGTLMDDLITSRVPYTRFAEAIENRSGDDIKTVIEWRG